MQSPLSLKTWPDVQAYDTFLTDTLREYGFSNLETEYTETGDGQDTWVIRDPKVKGDIICLVVDGNLALHIEPLAPSPLLEWLCEQLAHAFSQREDIISKLETQPQTYLMWSMTNRAFGPTLDMAKKRLQDEKEKCTYPALISAYALYNGGTPETFKE